jgi:ketosteroid isomerase-like protein
LLLACRFVLLSDGDQIRSLLGRYCHLVDAGDFGGVGALLADAVLCTEDGTPVASGAEEVAALYEGLVARYEDETPGTQHVVANTDLAAGADGTVTARSSYVVLQALPELPLQPIVTGSYVDTFDRDDAGRWRFRERRFSIGRAGNLSHHLAPGALL